MFRRNRSSLATMNLLELVPERSAPWIERDGRVVIDRPPASGTGVRRAVRGLRHWLSPARARLDALGSFTWMQLDGKATVADVCEQVRTEFGEEAEPVEERVGAFIRQLHEQSFVSYPGNGE